MGADGKEGRYEFGMKAPTVVDIFLVPVLREHIDGAKTDPPIFQIDRQRQLYCLYVPVPNSEPIPAMDRGKLAS